MIRKTAVVMILAASLLACGCSGSSSGEVSTSQEGLPEKHCIEYDESMDTVGDDLGADSFNSGLDEEDSKYYTVNDYYNMKSGDGLHIIPEYETYQQTGEYSCGPATAVTVLNHYGNSEYNELEICKLAGTDENQGTTAERLAGFFEGIGWKTESNASTEPKFATIEEAERFFTGKIDEGTPVMVEWEDWGGHWQAVIGIDTCKKFSAYDDVLIMADPYDVTDHYQDGYYVVPLGRFYSMWREGSVTKKAEKYEQPYVAATPAE